MSEIFTVYLSIPIKHTEDSLLIEEFLCTHGIRVLNPCRIVHKDWPKESMPRHIAKECWDMIEKSDAVILHTDYYGRDCACEIGYAYKSGKKIFPFYLYSRANFQPEDFMIISALEPISEGLSSLVDKIKSYVREEEILVGASVEQVSTA